MTDQLKPCPWCAGTNIQVIPRRMSPTMEKEGALIHVELMHHCPPTKGQLPRAVIRAGRDYEAAIEAWNTRPQDAEVERLRARVAELEANQCVHPDGLDTNYKGEPHCRFEDHR